jgi:Ca-activated chloride channel family protein
VIFVHPGWLAVGLAACLGALWTWRRYDERQRRALAAFVSAHLGAELTRSMSTARRRFKRSLFAASIAFLFISLAEPQAGFHWEQVKRRGNDIIFAVDTSRSMLTPDVKPDRLTRAKLAIDDFVQRLDGDAVGLVAFAGSAFLQCPLTLDYDAFHESLAALDTHIIPRGGTDISSAIRAAQSALHNRAGSDKILILVTDGEDLEGDALDTAKAAFKQDGLKIYTVGVGTANGDLIPLPADQGGGFLKDNEGHFVRSGTSHRRCVCASRHIEPGTRDDLRAGIGAARQARVGVPHGEGVHRALSVASGGLSGLSVGESHDRDPAPLGVVSSRRGRFARRALERPCFDRHGG